jgi:DASH complex subunit SPC19
MAQTPLAACVDSLGASVALLHSSISILDEGTQDFPRLATVLQTTRVSFCPPAPSFPPSVLFASFLPSINHLD